MWLVHQRLMCERSARPRPAARLQGEPGKLKPIGDAALVAGRRHSHDVKSLIYLLLGDYALFNKLQSRDRLANRHAVLNSVLGNLRGSLISDVAVKRGDNSG